MTRCQSKAERRQHFRALRAQQLPIVEAAVVQEVIRNVHQLTSSSSPKGQGQVHLGIYWPLAGEVDLRSLKQKLKQPIALPASGADGSLTYHPWSLAPLQLDACNILAPLREPALEPSGLNLLLIPALAIDQHGIRLGYGGGFYDRLRSQPKWRAVTTLAVLPQDCITHEPLPRDPWDIPVDGWITETGLANSNHVTKSNDATQPNDITKSN